MTEWITTSTILADLGDYANHAAWERFVGRFRAPITRFARGMGLDAGAAEDVAQETLLAFAAAYREKRYDRARGRLSQWLFGIAYRQAQAMRRRRAREARCTAPLADDLHALAERDAPARGLWEREWEEALLEQCLARVRQEVEPMTMRAFEAVMQGERAPAEAASELGIPIKAVYNAKYTVLRRLRELRAVLDDEL